MEIVSGLLRTLVEVNSIWAVVIRGVVWLVVAAVIVMSTDSPRPHESNNKLRRNLGFILLFLVLSGTLFYMLFSYVPQPA